MAKRNSAVVVSVSLIGCIVANQMLAQDPIAKPPVDVAQHAARRSFIQLFEVGQIVSYSTTANASYSLKFYSPDEKKQLEEKHAQEMKEHEERSADWELIKTKSRELFTQYQNATGEEREQIINELRGLGVPVPRGDRPPDLRLLGRSRPAGFRRPRSTPTFYSVTEVGADFVKLGTDSREIIVPIWSIRSVNQNIPQQQ